MRRTTRRTKRRQRTLNYNTVKKIAEVQIHKNIENKYKSVLLPTTYGSVSNTWIETNMTNTTQGLDTVNNRIGRTINVLSLEIKGVVANGDNETAADDSFNVMRIVIGLFDGRYTTPLASSSILISDIIKVSTTRGLIRKYYDKYVALNVASTEKGSGDGYAPQVKNFKYFKRFKNLKITAHESGTSFYNKFINVAMISNSSAIVNPGFVAGYICMVYEDA